jgi:hypothetical protein
MRKIVAMLLLFVVPMSYAAQVKQVAEPAEDSAIRELAAVTHAMIKGSVTREQLSRAAVQVKLRIKESDATGALKRIDDLILVNPLVFQQALTEQQIDVAFSKLQAKGYAGDKSTFARQMRKTNSERKLIYQYVVKYGLRHVLDDLISEYQNAPVRVSYVIPNLLPLAAISPSIFFMFRITGCDALGFGARAAEFIGATLVLTGIGAGYGELILFIGAGADFIHYVYC